MNPEDLRDELGLHEPLTPEEATEIRHRVEHLLGRLAFHVWCERHPAHPVDEETAPDEAA